MPIITARVCTSAFLPFFLDHLSRRLFLASATCSAPGLFFLLSIAVLLLVSVPRPTISSLLSCGQLTNNTKRPISPPMYYAAVRDSRTSGHHKGAPGREDGIWSSVCHGRHGASIAGGVRGRRGRGGVGARENHFELHSGEAIPPPTAWRIVRTSSSYYEDHARRRVQPPSVD